MSDSVFPELHRHMIHLRKEEFQHMPLFVEIRSLIVGSIIQCEHVGSKQLRPVGQPFARPRRRERDVVDSSVEHIDTSVDNDPKRKQELSCRHTDRPLADTQHYVLYLVNARV